MDYILVPAFQRAFCPAGTEETGALKKCACAPPCPAVCSNPSQRKKLYPGSRKSVYRFENRYIVGL